MNNLQAIHESCPNATVLNWFGATEATGCIFTTSISVLSVEQGRFPERIALDEFWGIEEVGLLDPEDRLKSVPKVDGSRRVFSIVPKGPLRSNFIGSPPEVCAETFGVHEGKQTIMYGDIAEYVRPKADAIVVHGRIGRDIKINGVFVNLNFFDTFVAKRKLSSGRTFTILAQGLIVLFF